MSNIPQPLETLKPPKEQFKDGLPFIRELVEMCNVKPEDAIYVYRHMMTFCHSLSKTHGFGLDGSAVRRANDPALKAELRNKLP